MAESSVLKSTESLWQHTGEKTSYPPLEGEVKTDVAIVGGGITGLTTAVCLQKAGKQVTLIEAENIGSGVSGMNSGHLTSLALDTGYISITSKFGENKARLVAQSLQDAIGTIERNAQRYGIDCDFQYINGYLFAEKPKHTKELLKEYRVTEQTGLVVGLTEDVPLPFRTEEAMLITRQARFHPLKYVLGLAERFQEMGGQIFEQSRIIKISGATPFCLECKRGSIQAQDVVLATHTPIGFRPALQTRLIPYRSYIIGVRVQDEIEDALYWDMQDPYHYIRIAHDENGSLLIIGGEDHKTGERSDTEICFSALECYTRERFRVTAIDYRWSAQLYNSADGLPYIGKLSGVYIATGLTGEGLTFGTAAGKIISDQILEKSNPYSGIYNPARIAPGASLGGMIEENISTAWHFLGDRVQKYKRGVEDLAPGEGEIMQVDGERRAVYRDLNDQLHVMSPVCRHAGCLVHWNSAESSWDCPCHGGRYDCQGRVLNGPPVEDLEKIDIRDVKASQTEHKR